MSFVPCRTLSSWVFQLDSKCYLIRCLLCPRSHANNSCNCLRVTTFVKSEFIWLATPGPSLRENHDAVTRSNFDMPFAREFDSGVPVFFTLKQKSHQDQHSWADINRCSPFCRIRLKRSRLKYQMQPVVSSFHITHNAGSDDSLLRIQHFIWEELNQFKDMYAFMNDTCLRAKLSSGFCQHGFGTWKKPAALVCCAIGYLK